MAKNEAAKDGTGTAGAGAPAGAAAGTGAARKKRAPAKARTYLLIALDADGKPATVKGTAATLSDLREQVPLEEGIRYVEAAQQGDAFEAEKVVTRRKIKAAK